MVGYLEGILKIANLFLSVVAGSIAISLFKASGKRKLKQMPILHNHVTDKTGFYKHKLKAFFALLFHNAH